MNYIWDGFIKAIELLIGFDKEIYEIIGLSLFVSTTATLIASFIFAPLGCYFGIKEFKYKRGFSRLVYNFMSIPSVIVGLVVALLFTRNGPLGFFGIMYTPKAMILAQSLLVVPLIFGLTYNLAMHRGIEYKKVVKTLGGGDFHSTILIIRELNSDIIANIATAFSRAISEVGAVMIVGGNIKGQTRVMTTTISMMNSRGDYPMAIALGIILLIISFGIHSLIYSFNTED
ncbi:ABC transporter permease subunit [Soehngenia saccharolytica]|jgi:tungstate transport system permease protein|nr:ABC transporter permease subunit [Soehngenia saccharolytica]